LSFTVSAVVDDWTEFSNPTLMRVARGAYASAIRAELHAIGTEDLPRNGAFILSGIGASDSRRSDLRVDLGVTRQAVSQLIDTLVSRGFVVRTEDPEDRRRLGLSLTESGEEAQAAIARGVEAVDAQLAERIGTADIDAMRRALHALGEIKGVGLATGTARPRRARELRRFDPIFPVTDLATALAHYATLGFRTLAYEGGTDYGFANRDGLSIHLAADADHDPAHAATAYLYVRDADALHAHWTQPDVGGETHPVSLTEYGLREGAHVDPDGNRIRFGSPAET
jgi:DNA-binding MarR family transcriptional regulator/catechol 2,3-dioxygenase-like lactoylglutathione lyase family enzyme